MPLIHFHCDAAVNNRYQMRLRNIIQYITRNRAVNTTEKNVTIEPLAKLR